MDEKKPCGRATCLTVATVCGDVAENAHCFYPETEWEEVAVQQELELPCCTRLAVHGTSIAKVRIGTWDQPGILVKLEGRYHGPAGAKPLAIYATDPEDGTQPCNVIFNGPGYLCDAYASDELSIHVLLPAKHRFETFAVTGRSVTAETPLIALRTLRISTKDMITANLSAPRIFAGAQGGIKVQLTACGDTYAEVISTRGDVELELIGFTQMQTICSAASTELCFEETDVAEPVVLDGLIKADTGTLTIR